MCLFPKFLLIHGPPITAMYMNQLWHINDYARHPPSIPELSLGVLLPMRNEGRIYARTKINSQSSRNNKFRETRLVVVNSTSSDNTKNS